MPTLEFGKYRLVASLGRGGTADVFLAVSRGAHGFEKLVVVKRLRADLADQEAFRSLLSSEARLSARLHHPNVVQTFEVGEEDGYGFIAMEYLDGQPLNRVLGPARRGSGPELTPQLSARIVADVLRGLDYAHGLTDFDGRPLQIVHRDISPHNVFVTFEGEVKVVDFGIAKTSFDASSTEIGVLKGKLAYMAPEQAMGQRIDARADIFAVGIVLWEMLASRRLFTGDVAAEVLRKVLDEPLPALHTLIAVDPALESIVHRALERDPARRYPTAAAMRADLEAWLARSGRGASADDLRAWMRASFAKEREKVRVEIQSIMMTLRAGDVVSSTQSLPAVSTATVSTVTVGPTVESGAATPPPPSVAPAHRRTWIWTASAVSVVALASLGAVATRMTRHSAPAPSTASASSSSTPVVSAAASLRLCGSNTIGAELAPALVEAFFKQKGSTVARSAGDKAHTLRVTATPTSGAPVVVDIEAEGTATAFEGIAKGRCDIGMASRAVSDEEVKKVQAAGFGDLRLPGSEHVIALDGIAVLVHSNNTLRSLRIDQLAVIFSGEVTDWSAVGGAAGPISVVARDDNSGTFDTFKHLVLGKSKLVNGAKRFADSEKLADTVASDSSSIGFVGLAYVRSAKALAIAADKSTAATLPSAFTVTTESYLLSRRLFFYVPSGSPRAGTLDLVSFVLSTEGQAVVRTAGFVDLGVGVQEAESCAGCSPRYVEATRHAKRLSLDFRFRTGSNQLDSRAARDVDRLVAFLRSHAGGRLRLLGFSDSKGDKATNQALSLDRAKRVADELEARGVHAAKTEGFGAERPVASNDDPVGREKNRRVEVWLETEG